MYKYEIGVKSMKYTIHSHRNGLTLLENDSKFSSLWNEIKRVLEIIDEETIKDSFNKIYSDKNKSLSTTINHLLKQEFEKLNWNSESPIFKDPAYDIVRSDYWRLDFAKEAISVEVAFNHSSVIAWNLIKPVLASELNHVEKAIQTEIGVVICATQAMKFSGNFDSAIGTYEKFVNHLPPLMNQLSVPMIIIGLEAPETFRLEEVEVNNKKRGRITKI